MAARFIMEDLQLNFTLVEMLLLIALKSAKATKGFLTVQLESVTI